MTDERNPRASRHRIQMATKYLPKKELPSKKGLSRLSPAQRKMAKQIYDSVGHFQSSSYDQWERRLTSDLFPDRPLARWVKISKAFEAYRANHVDMTDPEKLKEVAFILVLASLGYRSPDPAHVEIQAEYLKLDAAD
jgi:hypothetical protein